ncbi:MAG: dicarboxylate/amino acid:cation symporter [Pseudomonadota bacterium]|nr:dicarboxylate/amino acid:cation symporter [Pseudomonadota bacterium]
MLKIKLHWQILIALVAAVIVGLAIGSDGSLFGVDVLPVFDFAGTLFLNALKMLIVPLVMSSIIYGISGIGSQGALGRLGGKTLLYYLVTSTLAIVTGLVMVNLMQPGLIDGEPARAMLGLSADTAEVTGKIEGRSGADVIAVFLRMVPPNIVQAAAEGQMLGLITFSLLFGFFMTRIEPDLGNVLKTFWHGVYHVMMHVTDLVMKFAPLGVFALVTKVVATSGIDAFRPLAVFFFTTAAALSIHLFITMPLILRLIAGVSPVRHFRAMLPALLTAFSTASSSATLPITMECVHERAGVSSRVTGFVLPLGATVNMDGTALYECVAALFIAQAYGVELGFAQQFSIVLLALLTSIGVAGIPAASLVAITIILGSVGLPAEAIGMILAVDRLLDMSRTSVNVFSDSCGAVVIGRSEGEKDILRA